ncbi:hypothetical protein L9F63_015548, partial [Diploptera punctata]
HSRQMPTLNLRNILPSPSARINTIHVLETGPGGLLCTDTSSNLPSYPSESALPVHHYNFLNYQEIYPGDCEES